MCAERSKYGTVYTFQHTQWPTGHITVVELYPREHTMYHNYTVVCQRGCGELERRGLSERAGCGEGVAQHSRCGSGYTFQHILWQTGHITVVV